MAVDLAIEEEFAKAGVPPNLELQASIAKEVIGLFRENTEYKDRVISRKQRDLAVAKVALEKILRMAKDAEDAEALLFIQRAAEDALKEIG